MKSQVLVTTLLEAAQTNDFGGYDPFDGLNSWIFTVFPFLKDTLVGLAWIQLFKHSPINLRPLFGVPKRRNPKGIGLFILGLLEDFKRTKNTEFLDQAINLADWLLTQQCSKAQWQHSCWGYHFDWKARAFYVPKGKPNVITTIYVAQALLALSKVLVAQGDNKAALSYRSSALDAANFIVNTLYTEEGGRTFFAYIPGEMAFVHNASLWAAAWVAVVADETNNIEYRKLALAVARQSAAEQAEDGSWVYGARNHHQFIDSFHTGYNLEALNLIRQSLKTDEFDATISRGFTYYKANFFETDGAAKYYNTNRYPLDMHSVAQAVITLTQLAGEDGDIDADTKLVEQVIQHSIDILYMPSTNRFVYQKNKWFTNRINYMRWTQAWVYLSLAKFQNHVNMRALSRAGAAEPL